MKKALLTKDHVIELIAGREGSVDFVEKELGAEDPAYVIVIEEEKEGELLRFLESAGYDAELVAKDPRGEDVSAAKGLDYMLPGWRDFYATLPKDRWKPARLLEETFMPSRERLHLKFWDIDGRYYGTAHVEKNIINIFWDPLGTMSAHRPFSGKGYVGQGDYEKGTRIFYFEELRRCERLPESAEKAFLRSLRKKR